MVSMRQQQYWLNKQGTKEDATIAISSQFHIQSWEQKKLRPLRKSLAMSSMRNLENCPGESQYVPMTQAQNSLTT